MGTPGTAVPCTTSTPTSPMSTWRPWWQWERFAKTMTGMRLPISEGSCGPYLILGRIMEMKLCWGSWGDKIKPGSSPLEELSSCQTHTGQQKIISSLSWLAGPLDRDFGFSFVKFHCVPYYIQKLAKLGALTSNIMSQNIKLHLNI